METAFSMQAEANEAFDLRGELASIRQLYGTTPFANGCILARRPVERGMRSVHVYAGGGQPRDDHSRINQNCAPAAPTWTRLRRRSFAT